MGAARVVAARVPMNRICDLAAEIARRIRTEWLRWGSRRIAGIDNLSDNVKSGLLTKLGHGWLPGYAPIGYLNDTATKTIVQDPQRFSLVRKMWEAMLSGGPTPPRILEIATTEWGLSAIASRSPASGREAHRGAP